MGKKISVFGGIQLKIMKLNELTGHDVYEFCYSHNYPNHWNDSSIYITDEDLGLLSPYIDTVIKNYHYYGPQKVSKKQWKDIKKGYLKSENKAATTDQIFHAVQLWLENDSSNADYFWILGI